MVAAAAVDREAVVVVKVAAVRDAAAVAVRVVVDAAVADQEAAVVRVDATRSAAIEAAIKSRQTAVPS